MSEAGVVLSFCVLLTDEVTSESISLATGLVFNDCLLGEATGAEGDVSVNILVTAGKDDGGSEGSDSDTVEEPCFVVHGLLIAFPANVPIVVL